jgi:hypothetical protein
MMKINRIIYFIYYIKSLDRKRFCYFINYASIRAGKSKLFLLFNAIRSVFIYNISILEYFQFRFFEKEKEEFLTWAGTGFMFEYQKKMNPTKKRSILENKITFNNYFTSFIKRDFTTLKMVENNPDTTIRFLKKDSGRIVLKNSKGQAGREVKILDTGNLTTTQLLAVMREGKYDLVEEYISQHPLMMSLSSSGLNTVRIITQEIKGDIVILAARLRISINSEVDNLAAGNAAAPVDLTTGKVNGPGVFSDIIKPDITVHPISGVEINGFQIPYWQEVVEMVKRAAIMIPENRSVGWDVGITPQGPLLVEGNHNWCKLLWQLPVKKGLKGELIKYL